MKNFFKSIYNNKFKILINIALIILFFIIADIFVYYKITDYYLKFHHLKITHNNVKTIKEYYIKNKIEKLDNETVKGFLRGYFSDRRGVLNPRNSTDKSWVFTGDSFTYGYDLKAEESLPYRISEITDHPVYNLGIPSGGLSQLLFLTESGLFDEYVGDPYPPELIVYLYLDFHVNRLVMSNQFAEPFLILYKIKNNKLVRKLPPFFVKRSALLSVLNEKLYFHVLRNNNIYKKYLEKLIKMHFMQIKRNIQNKYPDTKFVIIIFSNCAYFSDIENELRNEGFYIINLKDDLGFSINNRSLFTASGHPTAYVWELVYRSLAEKLEDISGIK